MESKHHCTTCTKPCTKDTCSAWFVRCPPKPCETCDKPLYEIITFCNANEKEFNVIINSKYLRIQGFVLAFVDECRNPIIFDDCNSLMKIESITPYPNPYPCQGPPTCDYYREISPFANKDYYTYTIQEHNCMPINPALWSYYVNVDVPLKLSFKLNYNYTGNVFMYINMFVAQEHCALKLEPIIRNCIKSDQELNCVKDPFWCGYISWMTDLEEMPCYYPPANYDDDYPYNY